MGGAGIDNVFIVSGGVVGAAAFTNVSGVEALVLLGTDNTVTLTNSSVVGTSIGVFNVADGVGDNVVDASAVVNTPVAFYAKTGNDTFKGGGGSDGFIFGAANLTSGDTVVGGGGFDVLSITSNGTVTVANNSGVSQIESVQLLAGGEFDLANTLSTTTLTGLGTAAVDKFDGTAVTNYQVTLIGGGGADTLIGGSKDDTLVVPDSNFASLDGRGGNDTVVVAATTAGQLFDVRTVASNMHSVEVIGLDNTAATSVSVNITGGNVSAISSNNTLYIAGSLNDQVFIDTGFTQLKSGDVNNSIASTVGYTFTHYHHNSSGADLYIADDIVVGQLAGGAPLVGVGGDPAVNVNNTNFAANYTTGNPAGVLIADTNAVVHDPDDAVAPGTPDALIIQLNITITDPHSGASEFLKINAAGHSFLASHPELTVTGENTQTLHISGTAVDTVYQTLLRDIAYVNTDTSGTLNTSDRHISVIAVDGSGRSSAPAQTTVSIVANHAPVASPVTLAAIAEDSGAHTITAAELLAGVTDPDGQPTTITSLTIQSGLGTLTQLNATTWSYTPAANDDTGVTFSYTASDGSLSSSSTASLDITPANDAPVASPVTLTAIAEDSGVRVITAAELLAGVTDPDGQPTTITSLTIQSGLGTLTQINATAWSYTPAANDATSVTFSYTATDGSLSSSSTASLDITPVNDAPVGTVPGAQTATEDTALAIAGVSVADIDSTVTVTLSVNHGVLNVTGPGVTGNGTNTLTIALGTPGAVNTILSTLTYQGGSNFSGPDTLTMVTSDGSLSDTNTVAITVNAANDAPVAVDDVATQAVLENTSLVVDAAHGVLANDTDVDGPSLSAVAGTFATAHGGQLILAANGSYTYTAPTGYFGTDTVNYTVTDGSLTDTGMLTIEVTEQGIRTLDATAFDNHGDANPANDEMFFGDGNTPLNYNVSDNHAAGLELGLKVHYRTGVDILASSQEPNGTAHYIVPAGFQVVDLAHDVHSAAGNRAAWSFDFSVDTEANGVSGKTLDNYNFSITISDTDGHSQVYQLQHLGPGNTPWALVGGGGAFADEDGSDIHLSQNSVNIGFNFLLNAFGPDALSEGKHYNIQLSATNAVTGALVGSVQDALTLNSAPVATPNAASVTEDTTLSASGNVITNAPADSDVNGDPLAVSAVNGASANVGTAVAGTYGTLTLNANGSYSYVLNNASAAVQGLGATETATDTFTYTVSDGHGGAANAVSTSTLTVTVHGTNDPVVSPATATADVTEDLVVVTSGSILDSVTDADTHDVHTVTAVNGSGGNVGTAVAGTYGTLQLNADGTAEYVLNNSAANVQALAAGTTAIDSFTYTVSDGHGSFATTTLNVNVHGTNDAPVAVANSFTTDEDVNLTNFSVLANDTDVDNGAPVTVARINGTTIAVNGTVGVIGGAVTLNADQTLTFTPTPNVNGDVSFTYTAKDSLGAESAQATVTIHINAVNDAPVAAPNSFTTAEDTTATFNVLANDSDAENGKPDLVSQVNGQAIATGGTVAVTGGVVKLNADQTLTFTPNADFNGTGLSFTYVAKDFSGGLESNTATVNYSVTAVNDAPVAVFDVVSGTEDTPVTFDVRTNDTDVDGPFPLNVTQINGIAISVGSPVTLADGAQVALNAGGTLTYTPAANANGARGFSYTVSDGTASSVGNVTVNLAAVNDAPVANNNGSAANPIAVVEDTPTSINVLANDTDVDGPGPLAIASINGTTITTDGQTVAVAGGTVSVNTTNGVLTFTPNADSTGPTNFSYVAKDGSGATSSSATVFINVTAVNDAPVNTGPAAITATEDVSFGFTGGNAVSVADIDSNVTVTLSVDHGVLNVTGPGVTGNGTNTLTIASGTPLAVNAILATLTYKGAANFNGNDTLTVTSSDGSLSDTDTVAITVNAANDAPVAVDDVATQAVLENTSLVVDAAHGVLANDTDVDGPSLSAVAGTFATAHGGQLILAANGSYTYTAPTGYFGTDTVNYTVTDGSLTDTGMLTIEVTEQGIRTLDATAFDNHGDANPANDEMFFGDGNTPLNYNVSDNHAAGLELGLKVHYRTGVDILASSQEPNGTAHYIVPAGFQVVDLAHDVHSAAGNRAAWSFDFSVDTEANGVSGKTLDNYNFSITISDTDGHSQVYQLQHLGPGNTPWALVGGGGAFADEDGSDIHLSQNSVNIGFNFLLNAFGPDALSEGKHYNIQLSATDAVTGALVGSVQDALTLNSAPVATPNAASVTEDTTLSASGNVITNAPADSDVNGDPLAVSAVNGASANVGTAVAGTYGTLTLNANGSYSYALNNASVEGLRDGQTVLDTFTYTISDGHGGAANAVSTSTLTVTVHGTNDAPTLDLDTAVAGNGFSGLETSGGSTAISNSPLVTDEIANAEGQIKSITLHLTAASGGTDTGEGLLLPAGMENTLETLGIANITGAGTDTLTITATSFFTPGTVQSIIAQIAHTDPDTTFDFNAQDRSISVTVTDVNTNGNPAATVTQTATIDMAADVTDTSALGDASFTGANRDDIARGGAGNNTINGAGGNDVLVGNGGDDTLTGGAGNDKLIGNGATVASNGAVSNITGVTPSNAEHDTAVYSGANTDYDVIRNNDGSYTVTDLRGGSPDGTDTLWGIETIDFATGPDLTLGAPVRVFDSTGQHLLGTFTTIGAGVSFANSATGANIVEIDGSAGPFNESSIAVTDAVTIKGVGTTPVVNGSGADIFVVSNTLSTAGSVTFSNLNLTNTGSTQFGVRFDGSDVVATNASLTVDHVNFTGFAENGLAVTAGGSGLDLIVSDSNFVNNGNFGTSSPSQIKLFEFTGDASFTNVNVSNTAATIADGSTNGIEIAGYVPSTKDVTGPIGNVQFTNVTVTGAYEHNLVYVQGYNDLSNLHFNGLTLGDGSTKTGWTTLFVDGGHQLGAYATDVDQTGAVNLTGVTVAGWTYAGVPAGNFAALAALGTQLLVVGTDSADTITGTAANDAIIGGAGNDVINSGAGNDVILYAVGGSGDDTVNGGTETGSDTAVITGTAAAETYDIVATSGNNPINVTINGNHALTLSEIEDIIVQTNGGGDTVNVSGDFGSTDLHTSTITVQGGAGGDTVNASGLASTHGISFTGDAGNDTFVSSNAGGNDTFDGGANTDTIDFSHVTLNGVTVNLGTTTAQTTGAGLDTIRNVENVVGTAAADTITGNDSDNVLSGGGGADTLKGGIGNDTLYGEGAGVNENALSTSVKDTAVYASSSTAATVHVNGDGSVTVTTTGGEGTDTLHGVEQIQFTNTTIDLDADIRLLDGGGNIVGTFSGAHGIQNAVDAVNATGMHIQLRGGVTFNEQFLVNGNAANGASLHSLTVESFGTGQATVAAPGTLAVSFNVPTSGTPNKFAIIGVENGADVNVQNLKVDGLGAGDQANGGDFAGIFFLNASGKVLDSTVTGIRNGGTAGTLDGIQHGNAIVGFATDNQPHSVEVGNTHVTDFQKTGILINGLGLTTNIHDSFVSGVGETLVIGQNGIQVSRGATGSVTGNHIDGIGYGNPVVNISAGVLVFQAGDGVTVNGNTINGTTGDGDAGIYFLDSNLAAAHHNVLTGLGYGLVDDGLFAIPVAHETAGADDNTFTGDQVNIGLYPTTTATTTYTFSGTNGPDDLEGAAGADTLKGLGGDDLIVGNGGNDILVGGAGNDNIQGGLGTDTVDYSQESGGGAVVVNLATGTATDTFNNTDMLSGIENAIGTSGADTFTSAAAGVNTFTGGLGNDTYNVKAGDVIVELNGNTNGLDQVFTTDSYTLDANVENLTLQDKTGTHLSDTQTFEGMTLGPITDGENGWKVAGSHDQEIVSVSGNKMFRMSSDPSNGDFGGPYSPELSAAAGETGAGAAFNGQSIKFNFKAVNATPDGSRLEVDFGNAAGTDRNNFLVIESFGTTGIRIAVSEPLSPTVVPGGSPFSGSGDPAPNDYRELVTGVDPGVQHTLEMRLAYVDGQNNDRIDVYLDGQYIGQTTTFENYHDSLAGTHNANAAANFTDRVFFRGGANGSPQDAPGGHLVNEGFYFDNLTTSVYNNTSGTGNGLANNIIGNSGDNLLTGLGGDDALNGGLGIDTAVYQDARSNYAIGVSTDGQGRVTGFSQVQETGPSGLVAEGTDGLTSIERLQFSDVRLDVNQKVQLFDGTDRLVGTFDHIQDAITAGADGYRIRLASGSYDENVDISKNIEIDGVNAGTVGTGSRGAESVIRGQVTVSAAHSATNHVTVNGIEVYNTSDNAHPFVGIQVNSAADVTVTNSVFFSPGPNASNVVLDRAILLTTTATGTIHVDHNLFTGSGIGIGGFNNLSWTTAIWSDGREAVGSSIDHNTFEFVRTGINADDYSNTNLAIANNIFQNSGSGISIGGAGGGVNAEVANITSIAHNIFNNVGDDFNLQNITAPGKPIGFDLTATDNHATNPSDAVTVLGGASGDTIKGSVGNDILTGNGGNDTLAGGVGDDTIQGGAGTGDIAAYDNVACQLYGRRYDDERHRHGVQWRYGIDDRRGQ